jgi:hypothetical protein
VDPAEEAMFLAHEDSLNYRGNKDAKRPIIGNDYWQF